jgi:hypothetical protein
VKRIVAVLFLTCAAFGASVGIGVPARGVRAQSQPKAQKPDLPKIFDTARYVYVEAYDGDLSNRGLMSDDRKAIYNLEKQIHDWDRYRTTTGRETADLVFVVHKGRGAASSLPVPVGGPPRPGSKSPFPRDPSDSSDPSDPPGGGIGAESGSSEDQLSVYMVSGSVSLTGPIWQQSVKDGLNMPRLPLFQQLKKDVEEAYPH